MGGRETYVIRQPTNKDLERRVRHQSSSSSSSSSSSYPGSGKEVGGWHGELAGGLEGWVGGWVEEIWVGGWVVEKIEENEAVGMSYCELGVWWVGGWVSRHIWIGGWVGGWVGRLTSEIIDFEERGGWDVEGEEFWVVVGGALDLWEEVGGWMGGWVGG